MSELRPWPLAGYAPGNYTCKCIDCDKPFDGDKRAIQCLECAAIAIKSRAPSPSPAPGVVEALRGEIDRLRPHYLSTTATDAGRRQMLDHFAIFLASLSQPAKEREGGE